MEPSADIIQNEIAKTIRQVVPESGEAYLFGSQARRTATKDSDWDILVLLDKNRITLDDYDYIAYPLREKGWDLNVIINTVLYTKNDWEKYSYTPFYKNVMSERVSI